MCALVCALVCALGIGLPPVAAQPAGGTASAAAVDALRPPMSAALQSAQALLAAGKAQDARLALQDAERKVLDRTAYETYVLERLKAAAAAALGDDAGASSATLAALNTGKASADERRTLLMQLTGFSLKLKDHDATQKWARAYLDAGGTDDNIRAALVRAALARENCTVAAEHLTVLIAATEKRGEKPAEGLLRAAVACQGQLKQDEGYYREMVRLIGHHPRKEYWGDLIARLQRKPGFSDRLLLDSFRLMRHVGALEDADDIMSAAQLALLAALPGEARSLLQAGFDAGALGKGPGAQAQRDLLARAVKESDADKSQLDEAQKQAQAVADGRRLFLVGQAAGSYGQADRAVKLMEMALAKGIGRHPQDARLHHALALVSAGQLEPARTILRDLPAQDGLADLAALWLLALR